MTEFGAAMHAALADVRVAMRVVTQAMSNYHAAELEAEQVARLNRTEETG